MPKDLKECGWGVLGISWGPGSTHWEHLLWESIVSHPMWWPDKEACLPCVPGVTLGGRGVASPGRNHMRRALEVLCLLWNFFSCSDPCDLSHSRMLTSKHPGDLCSQEPPTALEVLQQRYVEDFPGGPVVGSPPASAGDTCLIPGSGEFLMPSGPSATTAEPASPNYCSLYALELTCHKRSRRNEEPTHHS